MGHQQWFHHIDEKKRCPSITSTEWRQDTPRLSSACAVAIGETCPSQNIVLPFDGIDAREEYNSYKYANINIRLEKLVFETQAQNLRSSCPSSRQQTPDRCIRRRTSANAKTDDVQPHCNLMFFSKVSVSPLIHVYCKCSSM